MCNCSRIQSKLLTTTFKTLPVSSNSLFLTCQDPSSFYSLVMPSLLQLLQGLWTQGPDLNAGFSCYSVAAQILPCREALSHHPISSALPITLIHDLSYMLYWLQFTSETTLLIYLFICSLSGLILLQLKASKEQGSCSVIH